MSLSTPKVSVGEGGRGKPPEHVRCEYRSGETGGSWPVSRSRSSQKARFVRRPGVPPSF